MPNSASFTAREGISRGISGSPGDQETALIWLGGIAEVDGFGKVGEREDVFAARRSFPLFRDRRPDAYSAISTPIEELL